LNERQRRILLGAEAQSLGRGGISTIHRISGYNRQTIAAGLKEIEQGTVAKLPKLKYGHIRNKGVEGKKKLKNTPNYYLISWKSYFPIRWEILKNY